MSFITADRIHNGYGWLPAGTSLEIAEDGTIVSIADNYQGAVTHCEGVLAPGLVNAHCHLELSHMKGMIPEHTGLIPFLKIIPMQRDHFSAEQKEEARHRAFRELQDNGIVAIGDISNTTETMDLRTLDQMHFYTFVESIGFSEERAINSFEQSLRIYHEYCAQPVREKMMRQSIVPHAPYSVSSSLFRLIDMHRDDVIISIHNQESEEENRYYAAKEGAVQDLLRAFGIDDSFFYPTGRTSIQSYLEWMSPGHPYIFVHNTYTRHVDVQYAHNRLSKVFWCLCPNANMYIENTLPDINMFLQEEATICIGTDSLASNRRLSMMAELHTIRQHYPAIQWETMLRWATLNGARALGMEGMAGSLEPGKRPGIVQLMGLDNAGAEPMARRVV